MKFLKSMMTLAALAFAAQSQAAILSFENQTPASLTEGDSFTVDVVVSDLGGEIVSAYDFNISWDTSFLSLDTVSFTDALAADPFDEVVGDAPDGPGMHNVFGFSFESDADILARQGGDSVTLLSLAFDTLNAGMTSLAFAGSPFAGGIIDVKGTNAEELQIAELALPITIDPRQQGVPAPGAAMLLALGLATLLRRRTA